MKALVPVVALALACCSRSESRTGTMDAAPPSRGDAGVSARCGAAPCPDYATEVARIRKLATPGQGPGCSRASIGRCGAARYVEFSDGFSGFEEYFDVTGAMVAVHSRADIDPGGSWYGPAQLCERRADEVLCDGGYVDAGR
ncbi:MAG: hypothetical protein U0235_00715 [Polyangiaceae bacterium]